MSIILGPRGVGKTTTLVQLLLDFAQQDYFSEKILYVQADHFVMDDLTLYEIAETFQSLGGEFLAIDEIHKYAKWSQELKSIYDTFPKLKIIVSGSSALEIHKGSHDLTRRAICYKMQGLSFREYLEMKIGGNFPIYSLDSICKDHEKIAEKILELSDLYDFKILAEFQNYLKHGYFPYFFEVGNEENYRITLEQNLHATIESDLPSIYPNLNGGSVAKIKGFLKYIASAVPFVPNWHQIAVTLSIGDVRTLKNYCALLEEAGIIRLISRSTKKMSKLNSTGKIYIDNTNQLFAFSPINPEKGTLQELFFLSNVSLQYDLSCPRDGDFFVDNSYVFEIGGKGKNFNQIKGKNDSYLAIEDIESGIGKKIPLWLFGFLY
jgi:uncharacterized protein